MKIIFLDIDGVLNSGEYVRKNNIRGLMGTEGIDPEAVTRLNQIVEATGAVVVVSSSWRFGTPLPTLDHYLTKRGFLGYIIGATPVLPSERGDEIGLWLRAVPVVDKFVIIDDDADMGNLMDHLIKTSWETGLQDEHVDMAIKILGKT